MKLSKLSMALVLLGIVSFLPAPAIALPPANDIPEEYLRAQIILEGRSPLDGEVISAGEYADLAAKIEKEITDRADLIVVNKYRETAFLLRLRKLFLNFGLQINPR